MNIVQSAWTGMVPVDDSALYVTDTGGRGRPVVYLNGAYADQSHWRRVIADLGSDYRHITYDERARGRSKRSADYSFEAYLRDLDAVLKARGVEQPLLVGWSMGAIIAWHWVDRNPDRALGVVCVDAFPVGLTGEAGRERIRKLFRRWRFFLPLAARFGLAARMTADQHAEVNVEANEVAAASVPVLDRLTCPVRFVLATGDSLGTKGGEMEQGRATLDSVLDRNPNLKVSAKVTSNHSTILRKDAGAIAQAVRETAAARSVPADPRRATAPRHGTGPRVILARMKSLLVALLIWSAGLALSGQRAADPVGHPAGYQSFEQVRSFDRKQDPTHGTVFLNAPAATVTTAGQPYPYGSVLVMEWRNGGKDGAIVRLDVMRKEQGYGAAYGADKNGDWEYASYSPDGKLITDAAAALACAKCHLKAGTAKDFVYVGRFPAAQ